MAILATGVTKVSGKAADTSGEVVLTAADVGALSNTQMMDRGGSSTYYIKLADLTASPGPYASGVTGIISGGSDIGTNVVPCFYFSASTRGYSDGTANLKMVNFVDGSYVSGMELFSVLNGARTEIWLKTTVYPYEVKVSFLSGAYYNTFPANNTTTRPSGIVSRLVPTAVYHTGFKPTAADIQNVVSPVSSGGIIERGSNANGEYVKFADGTMICTGTVIVAANTYTSAWTFPVAFSATPMCHSLTAGAASGTNVGAFVNEHSSTSSTSLTVKTLLVQVGAINQISSNIGSRVTAIGRWK